MAGKDLPTPPYQAPKKGNYRESKASPIAGENRRISSIKQHNNSRKHHSFTNARNSMFLHHHHCSLVEEESFLGIYRWFNGSLPVITTVRRLASTPSVTCSAVDADPNPLAPALPVMSERIPITDLFSLLRQRTNWTTPGPTEANSQLQPRRERKEEVSQQGTQHNQQEVQESRKSRQCRHRRRTSTCLLRREVEGRAETGAGVHGKKAEGEGEVIYGWGTRVTVWLGSRSATPRGGERRETERTEAAGRKGIGLGSAGASWPWHVILRGFL